MITVKELQLRITGLILCASLLAAGSSAFGQATGFTYQGSLRGSAGAAHGQYDFQFKLFDASTSGSQVGITSTKSNIIVTGGMFTVALDFGSGAFPGSDRWLEISAKLTTDSTFTMLTPRQQIASAPYTIQSLNAATATTAVTATTATTANNATQLGGVAANQYVLTGDARLSDARAASSVNFNTATLSGVLPIAKGGTGSSAQNFVDLSNNQNNIGGDKTFTGTVSGTFSGDGSALTNIRGTLPWQLVTGTSQQAVANNGYVVSNVSQVTVTLPTTINVGDIVRVSAVNIGGWKIAQNTGQSIVGPSPGTIGVGWIPRDSTRVWESLASSSDGRKLIAGSSDLLYTSTDFGISWTPRGINGDWRSVASSADGNKLVAVDNGGLIYTSTDSGVNWTPHNSNRGWSSVASSTDGGSLVAVVSIGQIYTSTDSGLTWTARDSSRDWVSVASSADGSKLVAAVSSGQIYTSTDFGATWTPRNTARRWSAVASSADGSRLVATVLSGQIYTSTDFGVTWIAHESSRTWFGVASSADGTRLVAAAYADLIYTSTDSGVSWTPRDSNRQWLAAASSADGSKLVAGVASGQIYTSDLTTTSGTAGSLVGERYAAIELQYIGNGQFITLSHEGIIVGF